MTHTILIADDEVHIVKLIRIPIESAGYKTILANNGDEAWEKIQQHQPSLIISDIMMPGKNGFELLELARSNVNTRSIPFIFLTARVNIQDKIRGLEMGADEYLTKPFHIDELMLRVKSTLQRVEKVQGLPKSENQTDGIIGNLSQMSLPDLLQILELGWKTGVISLTRDNETGSIYLQNGKIVHALWHKLTGPDAFFRLIRWKEGQFKFTEKPLPDSAVTMSESSQGLVMEGLRQSDEIEKIKWKLPDQNVVLLLNDNRLILADIPDDYQKVLMLIDNKSTMNELIEKCPFNELFFYQGLEELFNLQVIVPGNKLG